MAGKKLKAKGRAILQAKVNMKIPEFNIMNYTLSMMKALNYYGSEVDEKEKRKFVMKYWKDQGKDVSKLNSLSDGWFCTYGAVAHMVQQGVPVSEHDVIRLDDAYDVFLKKVQAKEAVAEDVAPVQQKVQRPTIQENMDEAASEHIGEIEGALDNLQLNGTSFDCKTYLAKNQVKSPIVKRIGDWFKKKLKQYNEIPNDKEIIDAYGGKRSITKMIAQIEVIIADCATSAVIQRTTRVPRARKAKPASVLVSKMKWMKEFIELKLKSVHPEKIVGASMVVFYDTIKRKLIKYEASDGYTLTVKGTTIMNFNPEKSFSKIVRKPEEQLKGVQAMSKRPINNLLNEIKATSGKVNGRTNEDLVLIGVY